MNPAIEKHLKGLFEKGSFGDVPYPKVEESWKNKEELFTAQSSNLKLEEVKKLTESENRSFLALTFSGSLLAFYTDDGDGHRLEYSSIQIREDVPGMIVESGITLAGEVRQGEPCEFNSRMLKKTSPLYRIVAATAELTPEVQNKRISEAMIFLSNGFVKINKTYLTGITGEGPDHFTKKTMTTFLSRRHNMSQKQIKSLLEDYEALLETGILLGEKVPLGKLGKVYADIKPAQKARIGRNPATGEEMTIGAKPASYVPKITFSSALKERVGKMALPREE